MLRACRVHTKTRSDHFLDPFVCSTRAESDKVSSTCGRSMLPLKLHFLRGSVRPFGPCVMHWLLWSLSDSKWSGPCTAIRHPASASISASASAAWSRNHLISDSALSSYLGRSCYDLGFRRAMMLRRRGPGGRLIPALRLACMLDSFAFWQGI